MYNDALHNYMNWRNAQEATTDKYCSGRNLHASMAAAGIVSGAILTLAQAVLVVAAAIKDGAKR